MFYVLLLKNGKEIVVPGNWCDENLEFCRLPKGNRNLTKRKLNGEDPGDDWKNLQIEEVLYTEGKIRGQLRGHCPSLLKLLNSSLKNLICLFLDDLETADLRKDSYQLLKKQKLPSITSDAHPEEEHEENYGFVVEKANPSDPDSEVHEENNVNGISTEMPRNQIESLLKGNVDCFLNTSFV